ncbi:MAG: hypothetical protein NC181_00005, partial [Clostridium sp.]|nr:hypothetical protein [Clostridium sp.]MCM1443942.1 hypothetical protein [Candidatus Amulumruptor caecigallinarius]
GLKTPMIVNTFEKPMDFKATADMMPYMRDLVFQELYNQLYRPDLGLVELEPVKRAFFKGSSTFLYIEMSEMKSKFTEIFGPDVEYTNGQGFYTYSDSIMNGIFYYDPKDSRYYYPAECCVGGGEGYYGSKIYKVEQKDDEIYVYTIVYSTNGVDYKVYDVSTHNYLGIYEYVDEELDNATIEKLINENKLNTYKFTYKKQSDGKYYVYSGEWM